MGNPRITAYPLPTLYKSTTQPTIDPPFVDSHPQSCTLLPARPPHTIIYTRHQTHPLLIVGGTLVNQRVISRHLHSSHSHSKDTHHSATGPVSTRQPSIHYIEPVGDSTQKSIANLHQRCHFQWLVVESAHQLLYSQSACASLHFLPPNTSPTAPHPHFPHLLLSYQTILHPTH